MQNIFERNIILIRFLTNIVGYLTLCFKKQVIKKILKYFEVL